MTTGAQVVAIQTTLDEIKRVSPDVLTTFLFDQKGEITAKDDDTDSLTAHHAAEIFSALAEKADTIGGLESVTFFGSHRRMNISRLHDSCLATVSPIASDEKYTSALTHVLVSTILRLSENFSLIQEQEPLSQLTEPEPPTDPADDNEESLGNQIDSSEETAPESETKPSEPELEYQPSPTEPPATQFIIERIGGLLVNPDIVRIDNQAILQWQELYGDKEITEVDVETLNGQTTRCKFKPIKDAKLEGKGIIQVPQKIQLTLQTSQGELVMVKPVVD